METKVMRVTGATCYKGEVDGQMHDNCKVHVQLAFDESNGNQAGYCTETYRFGKSENFDRFKGRQFPIDATVTFVEVATGGKGSRRVVQDIKLPPVEVRKTA